MKPVSMKLLSWGIALTSSACAPVGAQPDSKMSDSKMSGGMMMKGGMMKESPAMRRADRDMLVKTLSEEKTEIAELTAQQKAFRRMGGAENRMIADMWGRWIAEHKAAGPTLMNLIKMHGGNPMRAKVMKPPMVGSKQTMLNSTHKNHVMAVNSSKQRAAKSSDPMVDKAMMARVALATKHLNQMKPFHKMHDKMMHSTGKM